MHSKSDSEVTSLAPSSPRSPRSRPLYFVQSPSRESHDGGDSKLSFHSTPALSPIGSPLHPAAAALFSTSSRSRDSSLSFASASRKYASRKILPISGGRAKSTKAWAASHVIQEEGPADFNQSSHTPQIYTILFVLLSCVVFLIVFILLFWLICKPSHPELSLKNVVFHNLYMGAGMDTSGVPTEMISLNCTVHLDFHNPSKYFGVHVNPVEAVLSLSELVIAKGEISNYFQAKGTRKVISVVAQALRVPLYGASNVVANPDGSSKTGVLLSMEATLYSQYYVVGKMIKPKFQNQVVCSLDLDSTSLALLTPLKTACTYNT